MATTAKQRSWAGCLAWLLIVLLVFPGTASGQADDDKTTPARPAAGQGETTFNTADPTFVHRFLPASQYMTADQVKPGMVGYGLTVFQGTKIERFSVKVIGVVKRVLNGRDAILVRLAGGALGNSNVIKGMSGSPVFIDGKLVGAVSYGYEFSKEPIAGLTPIVDMLDALAPDRGDKVRSVRAEPVSWVDDSGSKTGVSGGAPRMVPLMSPVALVGYSARAERFLAGRFRELGMTVSSGAAGALDPSLAGGAVAIQGGSALSALLTTGDFTTVATGTATARFGNKVVGFGHPFLQAGPVDFPMATAYIHEVMPSLFVSAKVASPISVVGAITADRPWSIGGQLGKNARMIPVVFTVVDEGRKIKRTYKCQVVDHPDLTPELLASTAMSAIDATHQSSGPYVARVVSHIESDGAPPIDRVDRFSNNFIPHALTDSSGKFRFVADPVGAYLLRTTAQLTDNEFQKCSIKNVRFDITLQDGHETAEIEKVYVDKSQAAPGDVVNVSYVLRPYNKERVTGTLAFTVPKDMPDGNMLIAVASGDEVTSVRKRMGLVDPTPESLKQIVDRILERQRGDNVVMVAALPEQSLIIRGVKLDNPPAHWSRVFYSNRHTRGPSLVKGEIRSARTTSWLIDGSHILTVDVKNPDKVQARSTPYMISAPSVDDGIITTELAKKTIETFRKNTSATASSATAAGSAASSTAAASAGGDKPAAQAAPTTALGPSEYPRMRPLLLWRQDSEEDFRAGKTEGLTVDSWGRMGPGFQETASRYVPAVMQVWSGVFARDAFWFSTADQIWRWKADGSAAEPVAKLDAVAVPAMAADSKGTIYAAAVPGGQIVALDDTNAVKKVLKLTESVVTSLAVDHEDNLYIGTAGTGKVYKLDRNGQTTTFFSSGQTHVVSLFFSPHDKNLYVGCGEKGVVYAVDPAGKSRSLYQSADHLITGAVRDRAGDLYVSTAAQGHLVRILPSGEEQTLATSEAFFRLHYDPETDSVFSGDAEGDITQARVDPVSGQPFFFPVCHTEQEAVLALATDHKKRLFAGTSNLGGLRAFEMRPAVTPTYYSVVRDAGKVAAWSRLRAFGPYTEINDGLAARLKVETRTGDSSRPDETWSSWQEAPLSESAFAIASPHARYLQYRLTWKSADPGAAADKSPLAATIGRIETSYLPQDGQPRFQSVSLKAGTYLSGKQELTVTGADPDGDNLLLDIEIANGQAQTWTSLASDLRTKKSLKSPGKSPVIAPTKAMGAVSEPAAEKQKKEGAGDDNAAGAPDKASSKGTDDAIDGPDRSGTGYGTGGTTGLDGADGDKKEEEKPKEPDQNKDKSDETPGKDGGDKEKDADKDKEKSREKTKPEGKPKARGEQVGSPLAKSPSSSESVSESFTWTWETAKQKDGVYIVKFTLSDRLSNALEHQQLTALRSVVVDNTDPEIESTKSTREADGKLSITITVKDKHSPIANATYRVDEGGEFAMASLSGGADGLSTVFGARSLKASSGSHKIEVKVTDQAGNSTTRTFSAK